MGEGMACMCNRKATLNTPTMKAEKIDKGRKHRFISGEKKTEYLIFRCSVANIQRLFVFDFGPGIAQGYGLVKDHLVFSGIRIQAVISFTHKLEWL